MLKICLFGNIGSGKSSLAKEICQRLPEYEYLAIDDFRRKYSDGSKAGDESTKKLFLDAIKNDGSPQLIESSGLGTLGDQISELLAEAPNNPVLVCVLRVPAVLCMERIENRVWDVPFPSSVAKVPFIIKLHDKELYEDYLINNWSKHPNAYIWYWPNRNLKEQEILMNFILNMVAQFK